MKNLSNQSQGYKAFVINIVLCIIILGLSVSYVAVKREVKSSESIMNLTLLGCAVVCILLMLVIHNKVKSPILRLLLLFLGIGLLVIGILLIIGLNNNEDNIRYLGFINGGFSVVAGILFVIENVLILK